MFTKSITVITTFFIAITSAGCITTGNEKGTQKSLMSWFDVQREYAAVLNKTMGSDQYKILPIVGPMYAIGTPITPGTSSPITRPCKISDDTLIKTDFSPLPITKQNRTFGLNLQMAEALKKVLNGVAELGIKLDYTKSMELSYSDLTQCVVPEDEIEKALKEPNFLNAVKGKQIAFIRGEIRGSMKATSEKNLDVDPNVKISKVGDFTVKYNDKSEFNLEDTNKDRPRFFIVSELYVTTEKLKGSGGEEKEMLVLKVSSPSQETINGLLANAP